MSQECELKTVNLVRCTERNLSNRTTGSHDKKYDGLASRRWNSVRKSAFAVHRLQVMSMPTLMPSLFKYFLTIGALLHLCFEQGGEVGERRLLLPGRLGGELSEAATHGRQVQLSGVGFDERFERRGLRFAAHRAPPRVSSRS